MAIKFTRHILHNGLRLIIHEDKTTPLASCNIVYNVGSRDEDPHLTGMAHLFEHFMFCGSKNVPDYDYYLQRIGASNNAYTSQDLTHYYITLPANNLESALWLESDRMLELAFEQKQLDIQKQVVIEEFKENFLNRPFGSLWMDFNGLLYKTHPYQWLPIGKKISHIEKVNMDLMRDFYYKFYRPNNAVIAISGNVETTEVIRLVEKWFGDIPRGEEIIKIYPEENPQEEARLRIMEDNVPYDLLVKGWLMCERTSPDFYTYDLISDLFGSGRSSYLYKRFVTDEHLFTNISCHISATFDPGYLVIMGTPADGVSPEKANASLSQYLEEFNYTDRLQHELQKVKNKVESVLLNNEIKVEDRSSMLAISETLSSIEDFENDREKYFQVREEDIREVTRKLFRPEKANTLLYKRQSQSGCA